MHELLVVHGFRGDAAAEVERFKKTAKKLKQHENTIRYRINRLRNYLDVEEQPLLFHEIISLSVRIESMLEIKKNKEV